MRSQKTNQIQREEIRNDKIIKLNTMRRTNKSLAIMMAMFSVLFVCFVGIPAVSATIAQVAPAANSNQSANFVANFSFVNITDGITNAASANSTFYWNSTGSWVAVSKSGFSCTAANCIATLDISTMGEGVGYLNFSAGNSTRVLAGTVGSKFTVDRTAPAITVTTSPATLSVRGAETVTWAVSESGSGIQSTSVTITSPDSVRCPTLSYTDNSNTVQLTAEQTKCQGTYTVTVTSTDYSGLSSTDTTGSFKTVTPDGAFNSQKDFINGISSIQQKSPSNNGLWIVIIISIVIYLFVRKKN